MSDEHLAFDELIDRVATGFREALIKAEAPCPDEAAAKDATRKALMGVGFPALIDEIDRAFAACEGAGIGPASTFKSVYRQDLGNRVERLAAKCKVAEDQWQSFAQDALARLGNES